MDNQKKCPQCGEMIDADSRYCDQCGAMMYLCPEHLIFGKGQGKRCGQCGKELVAADQLDKQQPQGPVQQPVEPAQPEQPEQQAAAWREPVQMQAVREPGGPAEAVPDAAILWSGRCGSLHLHIQVR